MPVRVSWKRKDEIDRELAAALDRIAERERIGAWGHSQVMEAQRIIMESAIWQRGFRPAKTFEEAWERIERADREGRLRTGDPAPSQESRP